jgi:phage-related minor tail protein
MKQWQARGSYINQMPAETQDYIHKVSGDGNKDDIFKETKGGQQDQMVKDYEKMIALQKRFDEVLKGKSQANNLDNQTMNMSTEAAQKYRYEQELLIEAERLGIPITDQVRQSVHSLAGAYSSTQDAMAQMKEQAAMMDEIKGAAQGFFQSFADGMFNGKTATEALGSALKSLASQTFSLLSNKFLSNMFNGGGGGFLNLLFNANGNSFEGSGVSMFANGGAFTNQIFNQPTAFAYGGGFGNLGVMGEAGPEAVMPLSRGSNGKLGVIAQGGNSNTPTYNTHINVDARGSNGEASIKQAVAEGVAVGQREMLKRLPEFNLQYQARQAIAR